MNGNVVEVLVAQEINKMINKECIDTKQDDT